MAKKIRSGRQRVLEAIILRINRRLKMDSERNGTPLLRLRPLRGGVGHSNFEMINVCNENTREVVEVIDRSALDYWDMTTKGIVRKWGSRTF